MGKTGQDTGVRFGIGGFHTQGHNEIIPPAQPLMNVSPYQPFPPMNNPQTVVPNVTAALGTFVDSQQGRMRDFGSPSKVEGYQQQRNIAGAYSQPRRVQTNHGQESIDGRHVTSTDSRNPLMMNFGETSRDHTFSRSAMNSRPFEANSETKLYTSGMQNQMQPRPPSMSNHPVGNQLQYSIPQSPNYVGLTSMNSNMQSSNGAYGMTSIGPQQNVLTSIGGSGQYDSSQMHSNQRFQPMMNSGAPRPQPLQSRLNTANNHGREELELVRSKNKAFMSVTKEMFPEFLSKMEKMSQTVHKNINHSFTSKLKDIWVSYISDQANKNTAGKSMNSYMQDLKPIEAASVDALNAQTDNLIKKIKLTQLDEIKKQLLTQNTEPEIDRESPLFPLESDYRFLRDKQDKLRAQLDATMQEEQRVLYEMRKKNHNSVQQHLDMFKKEYQIKVSNDPSVAQEALLKARDFYINETARLKSEMGNGRRYEVTLQQADRVNELEQKIAVLKAKLNTY